MNMLKVKETELKRREKIVHAVLGHFAKSKNSHNAKIIYAAVDFAYSDELLFEEFELWHEDGDDKSFIHRIEHFLEVRNRKPLPIEQRDLTNNNGAIEEIKLKSRTQTKMRFAELMTKLCLKHNLITNEKLANFLDINEETARTMKLGEYKPQMKTLKKIADKFEVDIEEILKILFS